MKKQDKRKPTTTQTQTQTQTQTDLTPAILNAHGCVDCRGCAVAECVHRDAMRRNPRNVGGLGLCPRLNVKPTTQTDTDKHTAQTARTFWLRLKGSQVVVTMEWTPAQALSYSWPCDVFVADPATIDPADLWRYCVTEHYTMSGAALRLVRFDTLKRTFETAYRLCDHNDPGFTGVLQQFAQAVAVSVLRKCIDPQRKTAGKLETVSNSGLSGALLDLRRGIFHDVHALDKVAQAGEVTVLTQYSPDGDITDAILDPDARAMFDAVLGDTLSDGYDLVQTAAVALLEQAADHAQGDGWLDKPYTVRRPSRKVLIKTTDPVTYKEEETTPIQEVYRAVRRAIASSRAVQTDPRNGYTYLETETPDGLDTIYIRTGKYADLGG